MEKFQTDTSYFSTIGDVVISKYTVVSRTKDTISLDNGKTLRIERTNESEFFRPMGTGKSVVMATKKAK